MSLASRISELEGRLDALRYEKDALIVMPGGPIPPLDELRRARRVFAVWPTSTGISANGEDVTRIAHAGGLQEFFNGIEQSDS